MSVVTYPYRPDDHPPMPVVEVVVRVPGRGGATPAQQAIVDSGADGTLLPLKLLEDLGARHVGEARIRGLFGQSQTMPVYVVNLQIGPYLVRGVRVAASHTNEIILGRNVLAQLIVTLNGLASVTEVQG